MFFIMTETIVFIDAGYLSFISKFFGNGKPLKYKIEVFAKNLAKVKKLECKKRIKNSLEEYIKLDREIAKLNFQLSRSNSFFKPDFESDYK